VRADRRRPPTSSICSPIQTDQTAQWAKKTDRQTDRGSSSSSSYRQESRRSQTTSCRWDGNIKVSLSSFTLSLSLFLPLSSSYSFLYLPILNSGYRWDGCPKERLFLRQKKSKTFFHARISRSGKGRVSDFSATWVRVEGVGSPEWQKRSRTRPRPQVEFEKWKKVLFFCEDGILFFAKLAFSAVICGI
jgi:hypothetical protein